MAKILIRNDSLKIENRLLKARKVLPSKLDWFLSTIEAFWDKNWALMDFQWVGFGILRESTLLLLSRYLLKILPAEEISEPVK